MSTQRLPESDGSPAPKEQIDDSASPNHIEVSTQNANAAEVLGSAAGPRPNPMVASAPTVRGTDANRILASGEEPRDLELAKQVAVRLMGIGGAAYVDENDPIIGRKVLGTIVVIRRLGAGGCGAVYVAIDTQEGMHDQKHAIKVLLKQDSVEDRERFKREVSAAARAKSKRVVRVEKHGAFADGRLWMMMEHIEGASLDEEIKNSGPFTVEKALGQIGLRLIDAIASVHATHTIHRDLKPANIMLEPDGQIKLLDFGIARIAAQEGAFQTQEGLGAGSPGYWSPEGVSGQAIEYRTDVWGIAIIIFEMLTGDLPWGRLYRDDDRRAQMLAMLGTPHPSVNSIRRQKGLSAVVPEVEAIIDAGLQKEVLKRPSMAQLQQIVKKALAAQGKADGESAPNAVGTMRSIANLVDDPTKPRTEAKPEAAAAVQALVNKAAEIQGSGPQSVAPLSAPAKKSPPWAALAAAIAVAAAVAVSLVFLLLPSAPSAPATAPPPKSVEAPSPVAVGRVLVVSSPVGATIEADGKVLGESPLIVTGKPGDVKRLHLSRSGYADKDVEIVFSTEDRKADFSLTPHTSGQPKHDTKATDRTKRKKSPEPNSGDESVKPWQ